LYNFFYNYERWGYSDCFETTWIAKPYTIANDFMYGSGVKEPNGSDLTEVDINYNSEYDDPKHTVASFYYETDVLIGSGDAEAYAKVLVNYQNTYNANYNPYQAAYTVSSSSPTNNKVDALFGQVEGLISIAEVLQTAMQETGKTTRYGKSPIEIANDYEAYVEGIYYYVLSKIEDGALRKKTIAINPRYEEHTGLWTLTEDTGRIGQYTSNILNDLVNDTTLNPNGEATIMVTTEQLCTVDMIIDIDDAAGVQSVLEQLGHEEVPVVNRVPVTMCSILGDSHDNAIGIPWFAGIAYYDQDNNLNPVNLIAYYVEKFYHVNADSIAADSNLQAVINLMFSEYDGGAYSCLPDGITSLSLLGNGYSAEQIESLYREVTEDSATPRINYNVTQYLDIEYVSQGDKNWCWAASALMAGKAITPTSTFTLEDVVRKIKGDTLPDTGGTNAEIARAAEYASEDKADFYASDNTRSWEWIYKEISNGHPVIAICDTYSSTLVRSPDQHAVVIVGCSINDAGVKCVQYLDPNQGTDPKNVTYDKFTTSKTSGWHYIETILVDEIYN
ncbi:MAG: C39 family peptidase, partial [Oscillospiraceae bacterium]|nr:C39 family peptidase [Oscillospiraceae bacterium]